MKTIILAGGLGTRLAEETVLRPKPMVEIGGHPILWHILNIYSAHGFKDFVIACGYKAEVIKEYFCNYFLYDGDIQVELARNKMEVSNRRAPDWKVAMIDTGIDTMTGGRVKRLKPHLGETFMMTYGDGVGNVDVARLVAFHKSHGKLATITAVRPPARFGGLEFEGDRIVRFSEKPQIGEGWINGGYMVLEPRVLDFIDGDDTIFERAPMERLAAAGELVAFRHDGFWQPMDTLREKQLLESLWQSGKAPWKTW
jgi:glucose-1-phosphate cytidylyltransferase